MGETHSNAAQTSQMKPKDIQFKLKNTEAHNIPDPYKHHAYSHRAPITQQVSL